MTEQCSACGSRRLVRSVRVALETLRFPAGAYAPGGPLGRGQSIGDVRAVACVDCGSVQWVAINLRRLAEVYEEQQSESLQLSEPETR
jgi:hypothetical protein